MFAKPVVLGLLGAACVMAAAGGAYVAVRQNESSRSPAAVEQGTAPVSPVAETEALVSPASVPDVERPASAPDPAPILATPRAPKVVPTTNRAERSSREATRRSPANVERPSRAAPAPVETDVRALPEPALERDSRGRETAMPTSATPAVPALPDPVIPEPAPAPPKPQFVEVIVPASSVVGLKVETALSSETARVEDRVEARVTRDVAADGRVAIPAGARVLGDVIAVERGGKMKDKARLGVRFHTLVLADGSQVPFRTDAIFREGSSPGSESARKIGGAAIGGAVLGAIIGGAKGAAIGGATGAAGGSAVVMAGNRNPATLPFGTIVTVRLTSAVVMDVEREQ
jgi:hypothetical protein